MKQQVSGVSGVTSKLGGIVLLGALLVGVLSDKQALGQSTINLQAFRRVALAQHNTYRAIHHAPALTASNTLNTSAQQWANRIATTGTFQHSEAAGVGENLYASYTTAAAIAPNLLATTAIRAWYNESANYDYANPGFSGSTGHFTQVVWKRSTQVGCGAAQGTKTINGRQYNAFYVVCQYTPPGNVQGRFPANVQRP